MIETVEEAIAKDLSERDQAIALLRCWVAGCGDPRFSTEAQYQELLSASASFLEGVS